MGASRDFTAKQFSAAESSAAHGAGYPSAGHATALLEREPERGLGRFRPGLGNRAQGNSTFGSRDFAERPEGDIATRQAPSRTVTETRTTRRELHRSTPRGRRLGSQQVVTYRGRRLTPIKQVTLFSRLSGVAIALLIAGVGLAMWLSGVSTAQTFKIQQLTVQESQLSNQLETLNRDLENVSSSAELARRASEAGMGVAAQPGIIDVKENGDTSQQRPATAETESIIDVNGAPVRPGQASSDPNATEDVSDALRAVPQGQQRSLGGREQGDGEQGNAPQGGGQPGDNNPGGQPGADANGAGENPRGGADMPPAREGVSAPAPYAAVAQ